MLTQSRETWQFSQPEQSSYGPRQGFYQHFWNAERSCEHSSSLFLRCSEALKPQAGNTLYFFEVVLLCVVWEGRGKELREICVSPLGPMMVGCVPHVHVSSPQYLEGWVTGLSVLAVNPFTVCEGTVVAPYVQTLWHYPFYSRDIPNQVRGEAGGGERETKEQRGRGEAMGAAKPQEVQGRRKRDDHADIVCQSLQRPSKKPQLMTANFWATESEMLVINEEKKRESARVRERERERETENAGREMVELPKCPSSLVLDQRAFTFSLLFSSIFRKKNKYIIKCI